MDLGFAQAGFQPVLAVDSDAAAVATYRRNHPDVRVERRNLFEVEPSGIIDLWESVESDPVFGVIGGPPCQAFSQGNVHVRADDLRRELPARYAEILAALNDSYSVHFFVFENVAGLRTKLHFSDYERFVEQFSQAGFHVFTVVLDAQDYGVPQQRRRLFAVGLNRQKYPENGFVFPGRCGAAKRVTVRDAIAHLPEPVFYQRGLAPADIPHHPNHWAMNPRSKRFDDPALLRSERGKLRGRSFRVLDWGAPSWTVAYGNREVHVHPEGHRRLSVYEALLLQSFPPGYVLEGSMTAQFRQVGDAVPPPLARALAEAIRNFLVHAGGQEVSSR